MVFLSTVNLPKDVMGISLAPGCPPTPHSPATTPWPDRHPP
jgi:hypothetical protein